ncbi:MAG: VOC family protein [Thermoleophilaceae bacterium]|nr:VOC family protein [Thermoleophilaceae bacterium]
MIHHVNFQIPHEQTEPCARFYELLGFERVYPGEELGARAVWLEKNGQQIHLEHTPRDGDDDVYGDPSAGHIALVLEEYEEVVDELIANDYEVEPRTEYWGSPRAFIYDPVGHRIEIMAYAPAPADGH